MIVENLQERWLRELALSTMVQGPDSHRRWHCSAKERTSSSGLSLKYRCNCNVSSIVSSRLKPSNISWTGRAPLEASWLAGLFRIAAFAGFGKEGSIVFGVIVRDYIQARVGGLHKKKDREKSALVATISKSGNSTRLAGMGKEQNTAQAVAEEEVDIERTPEGRRIEAVRGNWTFLRERDGIATMR